MIFYEDLALGLNCWGGEVLGVGQGYYHYKYETVSINYAVENLVWSHCRLCGGLKTRMIYFKTVMFAFILTYTAECTVRRGCVTYFLPLRTVIGGRK